MKAKRAEIQFSHNSIFSEHHMRFL
jgi:hypothetical protein